jgi:hypothetical protein
VDRAPVGLADLRTLADTDVMDVSRLVIRVAWRWAAATRPDQQFRGSTGTVLPPRSAAERRRLVRGLSDRRDWAGLLRLAMDLPVRDAVVIRRWFSPRWQPVGERDRRAYSLLARVRPPALARAYEALTAASSRSVAVGGSGYHCHMTADQYRPPTSWMAVPTPFRQLLDLVDRPQAEWTPADLGYVRGARSLAEERPAIRPLYDLVVACMEWRFATDAAGQAIVIP